MIIRNVTFESVSRYLKASKSGLKDESPYELEKCRGDDWWTVRNAQGFIVAQMTNEQVQRAIQ